jgi:hypothetical protein
MSYGSLAEIEGRSVKASLEAVNRRVAFSFFGASSRLGIPKTRALKHHRFIKGDMHVASHFEIESKRINNNLHIRLRGDLDGSSAMELVNVLHEQYNGTGRVYIDTHALGSICPFGCETFQDRLNPGRLPADRIFFVGRKGLVLAPKGSKVIVASEKHACRCNGRCAQCSCSVKKTPSVLMTERGE